jgi:AcrR family transcriptional regulator
MPVPSRSLRWIRPPRQARSQETLARILDAAEALVSDKGFEDATVADIVARAGSSVGAFYSRFRDKDGLLFQLYERFYEQAVATADDALDVERWAGAPLGEVLPSVVSFLVETFRERRGLMRVFIHRSHTDPEFHERQERLGDYVSSRLSVLVLARRDEVRHPDPERAAAFGLAMAFAAIQSHVVFDEVRSPVLRMSDAEFARELSSAYLAYLGVPAIAV